jgi:acyl-CoA-dependent ceramide synthase
MSSPEPFPPLPTASSTTSQDAAPAVAALRRRKSNAMGELRHGDTGPAMATTRASLSIQDQDEANAARQAATTSEKQAVAGKPQRLSKRRRARGALSRFKKFCLRRTYALPGLALAVLCSLYMINPTESNMIHRFIFLSYSVGPKDPSDPESPTHYAKGRWDFALVTFYTIVLSFVREFVMQEMLRPLAIWCGMRTHSKQARFMEQVYTALYIAFLGPAGLYVMMRTPAGYFNTRGMFEGMPHNTVEGCHKFYYLFQAAFWAQQSLVLVLGMEARRKDFKELVAHHIITLSLIWMSYRFHFTYIGVAVYTTHDISDFFLATSKTLKYLDSCLIGPYYFLFLCVWIYTRHYLNLRFLWAVLPPGSEWTTIPPTDLDWEKEHFKCEIGRWITGGFLSALQGLNLFWLFYILRIAYRFLRDSDAEDDRSEADPEETAQLLKEAKAEDAAEKM